MRHLHRLVSLLALVLAAGFAPAQDEPKALAAFQKAFRGGKQVVPAAERKAALAAIAGQDGRKVAEALVDAWGQLQEELQGLDQRRGEAAEELARILKGQESTEQRTFPQPVLARYKELNALLSQLREEADAGRGLQLGIAAALAGLRDRDALRHLLRSVAGNKKHPLPLKLAAARAAGAGAVDVMDDLAEALRRAREPEEVIVLLDALTLAGPTARLHADGVVALLADKEEAVRERAALALARIAVPTAVEPMIRLLQRSGGQTQVRIAAALEVLTGEQFGTNVGAWLAWWQTEGQAAVAGGRELGKGTPSHRKATDKNYYFGIPQDQSGGILYVIDCSGSMKREVDFTLPGAGTAADGGRQKGTRLEACKAELIRALGRLRPEQKFGVIWYNDRAYAWQPKLVAASKDSVAKAQDFVRELQPASSTNIFESLELGFGMVGRGSKDKYYGVELDTIFLLTDGSPTNPNGEAASTEEILVGARMWNPLKRVTIHCIGIGNGLNEPFLAQLARENGGEFKQY